MAQGYAKGPPHIHTENEITGFLPHDDTTAIHTDEADEIDAITEKVSPSANDHFLIEDASTTQDKKRLTGGQVIPDGSSEFVYHSSTVIDVDGGDTEICSFQFGGVEAGDVITSDLTYWWSQDTAASRYWKVVPNYNATWNWNNASSTYYEGHDDCATIDTDGGFFRLSSVLHVHSASEAKILVWNISVMGTDRASGGWAVENEGNAWHSFTTDDLTGTPTLTWVVQSDSDLTDQHFIATNVRAQLWKPT